METVGDYEYSTKDLIGHGAFAVVFKGRRRRSPSPNSGTSSTSPSKGISRGAENKENARQQETVAIKVITKKNLSKSQNLLSKEIRILKELTELHHENVVALLDCKETPNQVFLVIEYCNGGDLADYLQQKGLLCEDTIRLFLRQIAAAMRALNVKGIVHRDLKPQNILLCHQEGITNPMPSEISLKIADFGFARFLQGAEMAATLCGSPMYMAPEVIMSQQYDGKADLWSVGTIVYQCLTGKAPFQAQTPQALKQFYERNPNLTPKIPAGTSAELKDLLLRLLRRNAKERINFEELFNHPFLKTGVSKPVPVPGRSGADHKPVAESPARSSINSISPIAQSPAYGSPLPTTSQATIIPSDGATLSPKRVTNDFTTPNASLVSSSSSEQQVEGDFIMINMTPDSRAHNAASPRRRRVMSGSQVNLIGSEEALPVPSQRHAFEQMKRSTNSTIEGQMRGEGRMMNSPSPNPNSARDKQMAIVPQHRATGESSGSSIGSDCSTGSRNAFNVDLSNITPPRFEFSPHLFGTSPPRRVRSGSTPGSIPIPVSGSTPQYPQYPFAAGFLNSPTESSHHSPFSGRRKSFGQGTPVASPFPRAITLPEFGNQPHQAYCNHAPSYHQPTSPGWGGHHSTQCCCQISQGHHHHVGSLTNYPTGQSPTHPRPFSRSPTFPNYAHHERIQPYYIPSPHQPPAHQMNFTPPELSEDTILDRHHNETLAKLNFVVALVDCILDLAESKGVPVNLLESTKPLSASLTSITMDPQQQQQQQQQQQAQQSETWRRAEQLVLYLRALQYLSSALQLSRQEIEANKLRASSSVRNVLKTLKEKFHACLELCKRMDCNAFLNSTNGRAAIESINADKLIYNHAIEMCQSAALEELFGSLEECSQRYQAAQILLHSLNQQATDEQDKEIISRYKDAVEKRLLLLQNKGVVVAYEMSVYQNEP